MKLTPQDKALLITFTGASFLVLIFFFLGVKPYQDKIPEEFFEIPVLAEDLTPPEEIPKPVEQAKTSKVRTHQAYNVRELRNESKQFAEEDPIRAAIEQQQLGSVENLDAQNELAYAETVEARKKALEKKRAEVQKAIEERERLRNQKSGNRQSTVSFDLANRTSVYIPNPVYTCDAQGAIVINITVNSNGSIVAMDYNKKASTSTNGCLIDQALDYTQQALFNAVSKASQKGSITFHFQG